MPFVAEQGEQPIPNHDPVSSSPFGDDQLNDFLPRQFEGCIVIKNNNCGVQTTLSGEIRLEPFEKAVERFRKQIALAKINPIDIPKINEELRERVEKIWGPEICNRYL
ncbi:hypothetical protein CRE_11957 [Caenorhabditis remanei]|uniref:Uncharacterized protein n=1 Tax=Caenorhabditis remanei TaxID=31234 RepID=E3M4P7_CAERE|nr:hypothetical protein CRE_11957 [Caenorhabditis remanei]